MNKLHSAITELLLDVVTNICLEYNLDLEEVSKRFIPTMDVPEKNKSTTKVSAKVVKKEGSATVKEKKPARASKNEMVETYEHEYGGVKYLVDKAKNVYTYDLEKPMFYGTKLIDGTVIKHPLSLA